MGDKEILGYWLLYSAAGVIGGVIFSVALSLSFGCVLAYPMCLRQVDSELVAKAIMIPMCGLFCVSFLFWWFLCFRWVVLKILVKWSNVEK